MTILPLATTAFILLSSLTPSRSFLLVERNPLISPHTFSPPRRHALPTILSNKIPREYREEIYSAEGKTEAAQNRNIRLVGYGIGAFLFLCMGLSNVVMTTMESNDDLDLVGNGYGWVKAVPFLSTGWGGYVDIIGAGLLGTMVELENRTREETAEKIWDELQRRKGKGKRKKKKPKANTDSYSSLETTPSPTASIKTRTSKKSKRLAALAEVILDNDDDDTNTVPAPDQEPPVKKDDKPKEESGNGGIMGSLKDFYQKADGMAAAQARLLNKDLEDRGVLDKITDESGLKVIGKEAVQKKKDEEQQKLL